MPHTIRLFAAAAVASALGLVPAHAGDELVNQGLISQSINLDGAMTMEQRNTLFSLQAGNLVGSGDTLINNGQIIQSIEAEKLNMEQRNSAGSTQCANCVVAGNPAASGFGF